MCAARDSGRQYRCGPRPQREPPREMSKIVTRQAGPPPRSTCVPAISRVSGLPSSSSRTAIRGVGEATTSPASNSICRRASDRLETPSNRRAAGLSRPNGPEACRTTAPQGSEAINWSRASRAPVSGSGCPGRRRTTSACTSSVTSARRSTQPVAPSGDRLSRVQRSSESSPAESETEKASRRSTARRASRLRSIVVTSWGSRPEMARNSRRRGSFSMAAATLSASA